MKTYDVDSFTYGAELEYGNCYRFADLPDGAQWNDKDNTCVSSTGIANDPLGKLYQYGGEINTRPTNTPEEQVEHIARINAALPNGGPAPTVNYRSNLHIHVRVPGLKDDLESCKRLLRYIDQYQQEAFSIVERIPKTDPNLPPEVYEWERKREKRRYKSHQYKMPKNRVEAMLAATTTQDFYEEHAPATEKGRMWYFSPRAGINLRQMWEETHTIEFRHFPGTLDMDEMLSAIKWCRAFLSHALSAAQKSPAEFLREEGPFNFPEFEPYEFETEQLYQWTNFDKNTRKVVAARLDELRSIIDIDDISGVSSKDVFPHLRRTQGKPVEIAPRPEDAFDMFGM
jgi:hypothetical protein